ncbi:hypothetical protein P7K49_014115 [Saguinus oedipus]|uniref:Uncharacterized protein n=1 Tax=Saguinus oedipus TaxID=9490 RepID=A0ABQ9VHW6_SAGOE|nr:hypothetical protein P7K49_014115 [Saguinus oedipus]
MTTLDDKLLGEKLQYYYSSSEDEDSDHEDNDRGRGAPASSSVPAEAELAGEGISVNTGLKEKCSQTVERVYAGGKGLGSFEEQKKGEND